MDSSPHLFTQMDTLLPVSCAVCHKSCWVSGHGLKCIRCKQHVHRRCAGCFVEACKAKPIKSGRKASQDGAKPLQLPGTPERTTKSVDSSQLALDDYLNNPHKYSILHSESERNAIRPISFHVPNKPIPQPRRKIRRAPPVRTNRILRDSGGDDSSNTQLRAFPPTPPRPAPSPPVHHTKHQQHHQHHHQHAQQQQQQQQQQQPVVQDSFVVTGKLRITDADFWNAPSHCGKGH